MAQENTQNHDGGHEQRAQREARQPAEKKSNRGFASMDPAKQREIASKGGRAAHEKGTAHQFSANEAREAGRKGGGTVSQNRQHMAEIGRIGGQARGRKQRATAEHPESTAPGEPEERDEKVEGEEGHEARAHETHH
jgi:general stress protein YciG